MDASSTQPRTDALGRRSGPRRKYTIAEKREIAQETLQPGSSVAVVSQRRLARDILDENSATIRMRRIPWSGGGRA